MDELLYEGIWLGFGRIRTLIEFGAQISLILHTYYQKISLETIGFEPAIVELADQSANHYTTKIAYDIG